MPRYNNFLNAVGKQTINCYNLGFGEQGAVLNQLNKALVICADIEKARKLKSQLDALGKHNVLIDDFDNLYTVSKFQSTDSIIDALKALASIEEKDVIIISTAEVLNINIPNIENFNKNILKLIKNDEYSIENIEKQLIFLGYKKVDSVTTAGEFSRRGDVLDVFNIIDSEPTRLDFFDTQLEEIYSFDFLSFERKNNFNKINIIPNKLTFLNNKELILKEINKRKNENDIFFDLYNKLERDEEIPLEYIAPFTSEITSFADLDLPIVITDEIQFENSYKKISENILNKIDLLFSNEELKNIYKNNKKYLKINEFYNNYCNKLIFFNNFNKNSTDLKNNFENKNILDLNFNTINFPSFLHNLNELKNQLEKYKDKQIYLCLNSIETLTSIKKIFTETNVKFSTNKNDSGIILTQLSIPYNICFGDEDKFYIGSSNFAHKKEFKENKKTTVKYLPKAGEYVVHSTHGVGKCEGIVTINTSGIDKEFFKLTYRGGDSLYVPYENADCLSLYMADGGNVSLNKLGGKEFTLQKLKAVKSIEDMSEQLLTLYAKRKAVKGVKYLEDDYLYTEFENSFEHNETADQLQAIADIKHDMHSGKVMDRLICGDVGFGKTEVAMRALFKTVEHGKQVAILAPTTILSLQHCLTATKRTKDFDVNVEMLNRFKSTKEQKQILEDLQSGKIDVICGTHRLLSKDVKFKDLGLLILDEEQRFGVKAKEQIKELKNNVNVLTLSATPIPRTLSMTLMNIRDISIINTPPINRLPVKTYVMGYNENIVVSAIKEELKRDGQVLIVYNNIEKIHTLCNRLKELVNDENAHFDVAHGQMSEIALENAIKRLYDKQTNVFVSTTLIENGVDLPMANTLIVVDSDKLGLSQMYQLRGRVGRSSAQAYAYFTYNKEKVLSEDSTSRLQAIAENTELGSGFKIAMRDLQIRGAGELLGKVQHGHMIKIGYDMYSKLLNETLRRLRGEKVEVERDVKIDASITSKIPYYFVADESERLKIIAKISNITSKETARNVINELIVSYGKLPREIYTLTNLALMKALAIKQKVKQITINKNNMSIVFYDDIDLSALMQKVSKHKQFRFVKAALPTICVDSANFGVETAVNMFLEFLSV